MEEGGEDAENKAHREGVMNQLLVLLNTAQKEQKELKEEFGEGETIGGTLAEDLAGIGGHLDDKDELRPTEQSAADSIEYVHGSLGIVPSGADDD